MEQSYNLRSPAVKRLMREAKELHQPTSDYSAKPLDDNLFEWHFTFRGPEDSDFQGGIYHGRIILPPEYPMKPPSIMLLNPNGRFELNKKICLSISGYHPESWQPSWSIRTAILAIIGFMPTKGEGAIGALDYTPEERKRLAKKSCSFSCSSCGLIGDLLPNNSSATVLDSAKAEAEKKERELAKQIMFTKPKQVPKVEGSTETTSSAEPNREDTTSQGSNTQAQDDHVTIEGIRQRTSNNDVHQTEQPAAVNVSAQPVLEQRDNESASLMLIVILAVAIAALFLRRLERMYDISSNLSGFF